MMMSLIDKFSASELLHVQWLLLQEQSTIDEILAQRPNKEQLIQEIHAEVSESLQGRSHLAIAVEEYCHTLGKMNLHGDVYASFSLITFDEHTHVATIHAEIFFGERFMYTMKLGDINVKRFQNIFGALSHFVHRCKDTVSYVTIFDYNQAKDLVEGNESTLQENLNNYEIFGLYGTDTKQLTSNIVSVLTSHLANTVQHGDEISSEVDRFIQSIPQVAAHVHIFDDGFVMENGNDPVIITKLSSGNFIKTKVSSNVYKKYLLSEQLTE